MSKKLFLFFLFFFAIYLYLPAGGAFADLEINYPVLNTGSKITTQTTVPEYLKYVFDVSFFAGFLAVFMSLVFAGALYLLSPALPGMLASAKDRAWGAVSGLILLVAFYLIIITINPALTIFKTTPLVRAPTPPPLPPQPGVAFYKTPNCPLPDPGLFTSSFPDLGEELTNKIRSAKIIQGNVKYVSLLFENPKFRGKCFYVDPNIGCADQNSNIPPFAVSATISQYSYSPNGSVTFFRNNFLDNNAYKGGYLTVDAPTVQSQGGIYLGNLDNLKFTDSSGNCTVPEKERDCVMWSKTLCPGCVIIDGKFCAQTQCPKLSGDNIGSVKIEGYYIVLFIYFDPKDNRKGPWSFCQVFPAPYDINRKGPEQITWEDIKNNQLAKQPNWVALIPVTKQGFEDLTAK